MKIAWGTSGLLVVKAGYETFDIWKGILPKMNKPGEVKTIFTDHKEHTTVLGITRHGKTFAAIQALARMNDEAIFFYNTQHEKVPTSFTTVDPRQHEWDQVEYLLSKNKKINWLAATKIDNMHKEIIFVIDKLYNEEVRNVRLVIDEVHLFTKAALKEIQRVATTGLRWGIRGVFISQRPAKVDNTLYTQSTNHVIFALGNSDYNYLQQQGFPSDEIRQKVNGEPYIFVTYNQKEISEAKTIKKG
jgi:hypothetical protein